MITFVTRLMQSVKHCNIEQIEMKLIQTIISLAIIAIAAMGCEKEPKITYIYPLDIKSSVACSYEEQTVVISYTTDSRYQADIKASGSYSASWISSIDYTTPNVIKVTVDENGGDTRSTTINISVAGHAPTTISFTQYSIPPIEANHTLMYLFLGTSLTRYYDTNLEDAKKAIETGILGNNNRIVFFRQKERDMGYIGELYYDFNSNSCKERILKDDIVLDKLLLTPTALCRHIQDMATFAPAKRYGLICAGHGQGWITREILERNKAATSSTKDSDMWTPAADAEETRAFGEENVRLNIYELANGISSSGIKFDYILFDACFMSNIEAIYDMRDCANYIIASPCEIMGRGFPYERTLPHLFMNEGNNTNYLKAAESYYVYYRDEYNGTSRCGSIAVYNCTEIDALAEATARVVATATTEYDRESLQTYEGQRTHHFYDFGQWASIVATDSEALEAFDTQLSKCVIAKYSLPTFYSAYGNYGTYEIDLTIYSGITTSAPSYAYPTEWKETNWYKSVWKQ